MGALRPKPIPPFIRFPDAHGDMQNVVPQIRFVSGSELPDYYPAIHPETTFADLDNQLWTLPILSAESKLGELVYDVIKDSGELTKRVRMPLGRSIAGFGHNGILYLLSKNDAGKWTLERATLKRGI